MKSEWERIVDHFEATAKCRCGNRPRVFYEPGLTIIDTNGNCLCQHHDGEGFTLTQVLAEWSSRYSSK